MRETDDERLPPHDPEDDTVGRGTGKWPADRRPRPLRPGRFPEAAATRRLR